MRRKVSRRELIGAASACAAGFGFSAGSSGEDRRGRADGGARRDRRVHQVVRVTSRPANPRDVQLPCTRTAPITPIGRSVPPTPTVVHVPGEPEDAASPRAVARRIGAASAIAARAASQYLRGRLCLVVLRGWKFKSSRRLTSRAATPENRPAGITNEEDIDAPSQPATRNRLRGIPALRRDPGARRVRRQLQHHPGRQRQRIVRWPERRGRAGRGRDPGLRLRDVDGLQGDRVRPVHQRRPHLRHAARTTTRGIPRSPWAPTAPSTRPSCSRTGRSGIPSSRPRSITA